MSFKDSLEVDSLESTEPTDSPLGPLSTVTVGAWALPDLESAQGPSDKKDDKDTNPDFEAALARVEKRMAALGHQIQRISERRTAEKQNELYQKGRTVPGPNVRPGKPMGDVVTNSDGYEKESRHQSSNAVDLAFTVNGKPSWDNKLPWDVLGKIAKEEGLEWGGDFKDLNDRPHVQWPRAADKPTTPAEKPKPTVAANAQGAAFAPETKPTQTGALPGTQLSTVTPVPFVLPGEPETQAQTPTASALDPSTARFDTVVPKPFRLPGEDTIKGIGPAGPRPGPIGAAVDFVGGVIDYASSLFDSTALSPTTRVPILSERGEKLIPFIGSAVETARATEVLNAARRVNDGTGSQADKTLVQDFIDRDKDRPEGARGAGYGVAEIISNLVPFYIEFAATGGAFTGSRAATEAGIKAGIRKILGEAAEKVAEKGVGKFATQVVGGTVGAIAQTATQVPRLAEGTVRRQAEAAIKNEDDGFVAAFSRAFPDTFVEIATERMGGPVESAAKWAAGTKIGQKIAALKTSAISQWLKINPNKTIQDVLARVKDEAGWNGILGELYEERLGSLMRGVLPTPLQDPESRLSPEMRAITGRQEDPTGRVVSENPRLDAMKDLAKQMAMEATAFAAMPIGAGVLSLIGGKKKEEAAPGGGTPPPPPGAPPVVIVDHPDKADLIREYIEFAEKHGETEMTAGSELERDWKDLVIRAQAAGVTSHDLAGAFARRMAGLPPVEIRERGAATETPPPTGASTTPGATAVEPPATEPPPAEAPVSSAERLARKREEFQAHIAKVDTELETVRQEGSARIVQPDGTSIIVHASTRKPGTWQATTIDAQGKPTGHVEFDNLDDAYRSSRGIFGTGTYGAPIASREGKLETAESLVNKASEEATGEPAAPAPVQPAAVPPARPNESDDDRVQRVSDAAVKATPDAVVPGGAYWMDPNDINVDMARFQFKSDADRRGVTAADRIKGPWQVSSGGVLTVWKDPSDGKVYVVNGHHRLEAAQRLGAPEVLVLTLKNMSAEEARLTGAFTNIAEGRGKPIDVAKVIRGGKYTDEELENVGIDLSKKLARDGRALSKLSEPIFAMVATGEIEEGIGVAIGEAELSEDAQMNAVKLVRELQDDRQRVDREQLTEMLANLKSAPEVEVEGKQRSIFEDVFGESRTRNVGWERAGLVKWVKKQLASDKALFKRVGKSAAAKKLAEAGNVIDIESSEAKAEIEGQIHEIFGRLANKRGPIGQALDDAAVRIVQGEKQSHVRAELLAHIRDIAPAAFEAELAGTPAVPVAPPPAVPPSSGGDAGTPAGGGVQADEDVEPTPTRQEGPGLFGEEPDLSIPDTPRTLEGMIAGFGRPLTDQILKLGDFYIAENGDLMLVVEDEYVAGGRGEKKVSFSAFAKWIRGEDPTEYDEDTGPQVQRVKTWIGDEDGTVAAKPTKPSEPEARPVVAAVPEEPGPTEPVAEPPTEDDNAPANWQQKDPAIEAVEALRKKYNPTENKYGRFATENRVREAKTVGEIKEILRDAEARFKAEAEKTQADIAAKQPGIIARAKKLAKKGALVWRPMGRTGHRYWDAIEGMVLESDLGLPGHKFSVYKDPDETVQGWNNQPNGWVVIENETGQQIASGHSTREGAIRSAEASVKKFGADMFTETYAGKNMSLPKPSLEGVAEEAPEAEKPAEGARYLYEPIYRPPSSMSLPKGKWELIERGTGKFFEGRQDLPEGKRKFGLISFERKLTPEEIAQFELRPLEAAWEPTGKASSESRYAGDSLRSVLIGAVNEVRAFSIAIEADEHELANNTRIKEKRRAEIADNIESNKDNIEGVLQEAEEAGGAEARAWVERMVAEDTPVESAQPVEEEEPIVFRSGNTRAPSDIEAHIQAEQPVGIAALMPNPKDPSKPVKPSAKVLTLIANYAKEGGKVFVDSGAFGIPDIDFKTVFSIYRDILARVGKAGAGNLYFVMPDKVGDADATRKLQKEHSKRIQELIDAGVNVIVPIQISNDLYNDTTLVVGTWKGAIVGLPGNKSAISIEQLTTSMEAIAGMDADKPTPFGGVHFLGVGAAGKNFADFVAVVREFHPDVPISSDATKSRAIMARGRAADDVERITEERAEGAIENQSDLDTTELSGWFYSGRAEMFEDDEIELIATALAADTGELLDAMATWKDGAWDDSAIQAIVDAGGGDDVVAMELRKIVKARADKQERKGARKDVLAAHDDKRGAPDPLPERSHRDETGDQRRENDIKEAVEIEAQLKRGKGTKKQKAVLEDRLKELRERVVEDRVWKAMIPVLEAHKDFTVEQLKALTDRQRGRLHNAWYAERNYENWYGGDKGSPYNDLMKRVQEAGHQLYKEAEAAIEVVYFSREDLKSEWEGGKNVEGPVATKLSKARSEIDDQRNAYKAGAVFELNGRTYVSHGQSGEMSHRLEEVVPHGQWLGPTYSYSEKTDQWDRAEDKTPWDAISFSGNDTEGPISERGAMDGVFVTVRGKSYVHTGRSIIVRPESKKATKAKAAKPATEAAAAPAAPKTEAGQKRSSLISGLKKAKAEPDTLEQAEERNDLDPATQKQIDEIVETYKTDGVTEMAAVREAFASEFGDGWEEYVPYLNAAVRKLQPKPPAPKVEPAQVPPPAPVPLEFADEPIGFGKYKTTLIKDISTKDPGYANWIFESSRYGRGAEIAKYLATDPVFTAFRASIPSKDLDPVAALAVVTHEALVILKVHGMTAEPRADGSVMVKGDTYDNRQEIAKFGGKFDAANKAWAIPPAGFAQFADDLRRRAATGSGRRLPEAPYLRDPELTRLREAADKGIDRRRLERPVESYVRQSTSELIERGLAIGMTREVVDEQIEDIAHILRAQEEKLPVFILASEPGSGKTFVLGGAIREILHKNPKAQIVYVTMNEGLIGQIKRDLAPFGISDHVRFMSYTTLRGSAAEPTDVIIFDEAHNAKNVQEAKLQAKAAADWIAQTKLPVLASATPFENPVQAQYLESTGIFEIVGDFKTWASIYGASQFKLKSGIPVLVWKRTTTSDEDSKKAREWLARQGVMSSRKTRLPKDQVDSRLVKVHVAEADALRYRTLSQAASDRQEDMSFGAFAWLINFQKRLLEASKIAQGIKEAQAALDRGRFPIIFVETKAERKINIPDLMEREAEWKMAVSMAVAMKEKPPARTEYGLPPLGITEVLARYMELSQQDEIHIPSAEDVIKEHFGADKVAIYTGSVGDSTAQKNLVAWRDGKKPVLIATMAKGGTGLSLHDKVGDHQTTQVNINLPWTATSVVQVAQRSARYGLKGKAEMQWIFAENIPFDRRLAGRVGGRMADMGAIVHGERMQHSAEIEEWNFEDDPFSETVPDDEPMPPAETAAPVVEAKPTEAKPAEVKPTEAKPAEPRTSDKKEVKAKHPLSKKQADLEKKILENQAEIDRLKAEIAKKLGGNQANMGVDPELIVLAGKLIAAYVKGGVIKFHEAALRFQEDWGPGARSMDKAIEKKWKELRGEKVSVWDALPRRTSSGAWQLEDALSSEAKRGLSKWFKERNAARALRRIREGLELYDRLIGTEEDDAKGPDPVASAAAAKEILRTAEAFFTATEKNIADATWAFDAAVWDGLVAISGDENPDPAELLENQEMATAANAGKLIWSTLDPITAEFDIEELNTAFGDVEFRRDKDQVFPRPQERNNYHIDLTSSKNSRKPKLEITQAEANARLQAWKDEAKRIGMGTTTVTLKGKRSKAKVAELAKELTAQGLTKQSDGTWTGQTTPQQREAIGSNVGWAEVKHDIPEDHSNEVVYSLFDVTGAWSQPWVDAGYMVRRYDIKSGQDLMDFGSWMMDVEEDISEDREIVGIIGAPPCTSFAVSGNRWWEEQHNTANPDMVEKKYGLWAREFFEKPIDYANHLIGVMKLIVEQADPRDFHALENPVGRMAGIHGFPAATLTFDPSNFGDPYTKQTQLWGDFNPNLPTANVFATLGSLMHEIRGDSAEGKAERSETPEGFAYSFFMANHKPATVREARAEEEETEDDEYEQKEEKPKVDILPTGEAQPRLPGEMGELRDKNIQAPQLVSEESLLSGYSRMAMKAIFRLTDPMADAVHALVESMGLNQGKIQLGLGGNSADPRAMPQLPENQKHLTRWYFSNIAKALDGWQKKGTKEQLVAWLRKNPGAIEEARTIGMDQFLAGEGMITRQEAQEYLDSVKIDVKTIRRERMLNPDSIDSDEGDVPQGQRRRYEELQRLTKTFDELGYGLDLYFAGQTVEARLLDSEGEIAADSETLFQALKVTGQEPLVTELDALQAYLNERNSLSDKAPSWEQYAVPGRYSNYREMLITIPVKKGAIPLPGLVVDQDGDEHWSIYRGDHVNGSSPVGYVNGWNATGWAQSNRPFPEGGREGHFRGSYKERAKVFQTSDEALAWVKDLMNDDQVAHAESEFERLNTFYYPRHWSEPNIIVHLRLSDRKIPKPGFVVRNNVSGNESRVFDTNEAAEAYVETLPAAMRDNLRVRKTIQYVHTLFVEEIQSDWHQGGRDYGYKSETEGLKAQKEALEAELRPYWENAHKSRIERDRFLELTKEHAQVRRKLSKGQVPDAPFKGHAWKKLGMKRLLSIAAAEGYEAVAWSNGDQQNEIHKLNNFVKTLNWTQINKGTQAYLSGSRYTVSIEFLPRTTGMAAPKDVVVRVNEHGIINEIVQGDNDFLGEELKSMVGGELANKLMAITDKTTTMRGKDLEVGGQPMREFYDQILPNLTNDIAKRVGAGRVESISLPGSGKSANTFTGPTRTLEEVKALKTKQAGKDRLSGQSSLVSQLEEIINAMESGREFKEAVEQYASPGLAERVLKGTLEEKHADADVHFLPLSLETKANIVVNGLPLFQGRKAAVTFVEDGKAIIRAYAGADVSSIIHELAHVARRQLFDLNLSADERAGITDEDIVTAALWAGAELENGQWKWNRDAEEKFARGFERYLRDGNAPTAKLQSVFDKIRGWLMTIYQSLIGSSIDVDISPAMKKVYDQMVTRQERINAKAYNTAPATTRDAWTNPAKAKAKKPKALSLDFDKDQGSLFQNEPSIVDELEAMSTDEAMGVEFGDDKEDGASRFPDGSEAVVCTNCARQIIKKLGRGEIYGWEEGTNPTSVVAGPAHGARLDKGQGHDFAVIDGRYLVDPWAKNVEMSSPRAAFDMADPKDRAEVARLYGDPATWMRQVEKDGKTKYVKGKPEALDTLYQRAGAITSKAFQKWFGKSVVVKKNGDPRVVYHGAGAVFTEFGGLEITGWFTESPELAASYGKSGHHRAMANGGWPGVAEGPHTMPVYLSIQKPLVAHFDINDTMKLDEFMQEFPQLDLGGLWADHETKVIGGEASFRASAWEFMNTERFADAAMVAGYDGIEVKEGGKQTWAIFKKTQAKSAIANRGTFSAASPNILYQDAEAPLADIIDAEVIPPTGEGSVADYEAVAPKKMYVAARIKKAIDRHAAGYYNEQEFVESMEQLRQELITRGEIKKFTRAFTDYARGHDYVVRKLMDARRAGHLSDETVELMLWVLRENPNLARGLALSIRKDIGVKGARGAYRPWTQMIALVKSDENTETAVHELLHHAERMMPEDVQLGIRREWWRALSDEIAKAHAAGNQKAIEAWERVIAVSMGDVTQAKGLHELFIDGTLPRNKYYLMNPSEFWAVNAADILTQRFNNQNAPAILKWIRQAWDWMGELIEHLAGMVGRPSDRPVLRGLDAVMSSYGDFVSQQMISSLSGPFFDVDTDMAKKTVILARSYVAQGLSYDDAREQLKTDAPIGYTTQQRVFDLAWESLTGQEPPSRAGNINLDKFESLSTEEKKELGLLIAENNLYWKQRRGVVTWEETEEVAQSIARPERVGEAGKAFNAAELDALAGHIAGVRKQLEEVSAKIASGANGDENLAQYSKLMAQEQVLLEVYSGAVAEAGRALNILRKIRQSIESKDADFIKRAIDEMGGRKGIQQVIETLKNFGDDNIGKYRFIRSLRKMSKWDYLTAYYYTNILSGPLTHSRNIWGNSMMLAFTLAAMPAGAAIDSVKSLTTGAPRSIRMTELPMGLEGLFRGALDGVRKASFLLKNGFTRDDVASLEFRPPEIPGGIWTNFVGRGLEAVDVVFRSMRGMSELYALAFNAAKNAGLETGSEAYDQFVRGYISAPPLDAIKIIEREAKRSTFREDPGPFLKAVMNLRKDFSFQLPSGRKITLFNPFKMIIPFVQTPANIMKMSIEATPVGFAMSAFRQTPRERAQSAARAALGTTLLMPLVALAMKGLVSGMGPDDKELKDELYRTGWRPNSIRIGNVWYGYSAFQPLALPLSVVANAYESMLYEGRNTNPWIISARTLNSVLDQSYLSGLSALQAMLESPDRYANAFFQNIGNSMVPLSSFWAQIARANDPTVRRPENFKESVMARMPGYSKALTPMRDAFGEESQRGGYFWTRLVSPVPVSFAKDSPLEAELYKLRNTYQVGFPARNVTIKGKTIRLTNYEYDQLLRESGHDIKVSLERRMRGDWARLDDEEKGKAIEKEVSEIRARIRKRMLKQVEARAKSQSQ